MDPVKSAKCSYKDEDHEADTKKCIAGTSDFGAAKAEDRSGAENSHEMANILSAGPSNNVTCVKESPECDKEHAA